jgi:hypothetical protein
VRNDEGRRAESHVVDDARRHAREVRRVARAAQAFPQELAGLYTAEEMGQADNPVQTAFRSMPTTVRTTRA